MKGWLIDYLLFYVPLKNISLYIWRRHHYRWRAAKFRHILGAQGLWAGRGLYRVTPAVTRGLGFSGLIRRTAHSVASYDTLGDVEDLFWPDPHRSFLLYKWNESEIPIFASQVFSVHSAPHNASKMCSKERFLITSFQPHWNVMENVLEMFS